ncbi:MAG TPA: fibronectin type III domain-containing protein, partial [Tepidisphaeraceae bacterium]|nr:fibronectin type III domain-containing protein [Tepidisphaeraceae bacterium]
MWGGPILEPLEQRCYLSSTLANATDSAVIDNNGTLDAVYYSNNSLYYVQNSAGSWSTPQLITTLASDPGDQLSLAVAPDGTVAVAYPTSPGLAFAKLDGSNWDISTIDGSSDTDINPVLSFLSNDIPVVTYYDQTDGEARVATDRTIAGWHLFNIDSSSMEYTALAVNPTNNAVTAVYSNTAGQLYTSTIGKKGLSSQPQTLGTAMVGDSGLSFAISSAGAYAVTYRNPGLGKLKMIEQAPGQAFTTSKLAQVDKHSNPQASVMFQSNGRPEVVFDNVDGNALLSDSYHPASGSWTSTTLQYGVDTDAHGVVEESNGSIEYSAFGGDSPSSMSIDNSADTPTAPTNVTATAQTSDQINISWTDTAGDESGFVIARSTDGVNFTPIATLPAGAGAYADTGLTSSTQYYYEVSAVGAD